MSDDSNKAILRKCVMVEEHGQPDTQRRRLVDEIIDTFQCPDKWPMEDRERLNVLRKWYTMALRIKATENAIARSSI